VKVILEKDIPNVGQRGQVKEVSDGYARNFLLPRKLAKIATAIAISQAKKTSQQKTTDDNSRNSRNLADIKKITETVVTFVEKANAEGKLFAGVHANVIAKALRKQTGVAINEDAIQLDQPIKHIGRQTIGVKIADQVTQCTIDVQPKP
jgi:large subunit ribosomal protein L9